VLVQAYELMCFKLSLCFCIEEQTLYPEDTFHSDGSGANGTGVVLNFTVVCASPRTGTRLADPQIMTDLACHSTCQDVRILMDIGV
jgi:hypothetical protein